MEIKYVTHLIFRSSSSVISSTRTVGSTLMFGSPQTGLLSILPDLFIALPHEELSQVWHQCISLFYLEGSGDMAERETYDRDDTADRGDKVGSTRSFDNSDLC